MNRILGANLDSSLKLQLVSSKLERETVKQLIEMYHSYVPHCRSVGRRIDWLIYLEGEIVGMIGIGSSVYPPPVDLLRFLNISKKEYGDKFNQVANNWRFCLKEKLPNLGSQVLCKMRCQSPVVWGEKYGDPLSCIITFVGGGNTGAVYKADNWKFVGETSGLPIHRSSSMKWHTNEELTTRFVKPTGENKKLIFLTFVGGGAKNSLMSKATFEHGG